MNVWWCEEHYATSHTEVNCWWAATWEPKPCRMAPMRLVPADALVVEKVDGEWAEEVINELADIIGVKAMRRHLDALAQASQVGESG